MPKSCIIVAPGLSLLLHDVPEYAHGHATIAINRAYKAFMHHNVLPDYICVYDAPILFKSRVMPEAYNEMPTYYKQRLLVSDNASRKVSDAWRKLGARVKVLPRDGHEDYKRNPYNQSYYTGPSLTSCHAYQFAIRAGFTVIGFAGFDGYSNPDKPYIFAQNTITTDQPETLTKKYSIVIQAIARWATYKPEVKHFNLSPDSAFKSKFPTVSIQDFDKESQ